MWHSGDDGTVIKAHSRNGRLEGARREIDEGDWRQACRERVYGTLLL